MKLFLDFFPIVLFFVAFKLYDIYVATGVAMVATLAQILWSWRRHGKVEAMQWLSLGIIMVMGGATLLLHDESFIKWKPTVLYAGMALALWGGWIFGRKNFIQHLMQAQLQLPDSIWRHLMHAWAGFFCVMGVLNIWVAYQFDTETWVNYKLFGSMGLMVLFVIAQTVYLHRYLPHDTE